ncbi:hypothetical protein B484DRAFT_219215 [Ochromonadaceae sp. CCMP2298]|nr:hypothetical protein B484DRAFT_219215 [Ochromonadaceae sp. CCMP2298]
MEGENVRLRGVNRADQPLSYKYMPHEVASSASVNSSTAKSILGESLFPGLVAIKHGRHGAPKRRLFFCDANITSVFWLSDTWKGAY